MQWRRASWWWWLIVLAACGGSPLPRELLGNWHAALVGDGWVREESFSFQRDGEFSHDITQSTSDTSFYYTCTQNLLSQTSGVADAYGDTLTLHIDDGFTRVFDSCGQPQYFDERGATDVYRFSTGEGLILTDAQGLTMGPFDRQ